MAAQFTQFQVFWKAGAIEGLAGVQAIGGIDVNAIHIAAIRAAMKSQMPPAFHKYGSGCRARGPSLTTN